MSRHRAANIQLQFIFKEKCSVRREQANSLWLRCLVGTLTVFPGKANGSAIRQKVLIYKPISNTVAKRYIGHLLKNDFGGLNCKVE